MANDTTRQTGRTPAAGDEARAFEALMAPARSAALPEARAAILKARILDAAVAARPPQLNIVPFAPKPRAVTLARSAPAAGSQVRSRAGWGAITGAALVASLVLGVAAGAAVTGGEVDATFAQAAGQAFGFGVGATGEAELLAGLMSEPVDALF